ncbi:putative surface protein with fasciclin (FAS1) repeats [Dysgonomonadaceae bacterium PH5-43]|nr:putative surface protein with fasciclin (FAS1) repeats [Dysgonomonadaceae bacterium PH5-43]
MKNIKKVLLGFFAMTFMFSSCLDEVKTGIETIESVQISDYLDDPENADKYSEFVKLIKSVGMFDLLNVYGRYTCFIPTNEAVRAYYDANVPFEELTDSMRLMIVRNHIISGKVENEPIKTIDFPVGSISSPNMNGYFIRIGIDGNNFTVNGTSRIVERDKEVHNGVIHTVDGILETPTSEVRDVLDTFTDFKLFYEALELTKMIDSIYLTENKNYTYIGKVTDQKSSAPSPLIATPEFCKYGYTVLMESDETFAKKDIETIDDLIAFAEEVYYNLFPLPEDADEAKRIKEDYKDRDNALNRFVSYHMMERMVDVNEFINPKWEDHFVPNTPIREYIEMMMPNSLIEVQKKNIINKNMYLDENDEEVKASFVTITRNIGSVVHVMFHEINNILTYEGVEANVLNKRLRMDCTGMINEFVSNKFRGNQGSGYPYCAVPANYFTSRSKIQYTEETQFQHIGSRGFHNLYGDELLFAGRYDFTLTTPPIPPGRWEIRFSYTPNSVRGVAQIFLNGKPCGIPQDLRMLANNVKIGWIKDSETSDGGVENDKMMRNRGYMKGSSTIINPNDNNIKMRDFRQSLRKIVSVETLEKAQCLQFRVKSVMDNPKLEYMIDYMEFVPSAYLDEEGID